MSFMLEDEDEWGHEDDTEPIWPWIIGYALIVVIAVGIWLL